MPTPSPTPAGEKRDAWTLVYLAVTYYDGEHMLDSSRARRLLADIPPESMLWAAFPTISVRAASAIGEVESYRTRIE